MQNTFDLSDESTWRACLKVKRGLEDTAQQLSFVKDAIYFSGREKVEKFLRSDPQKIAELYIGKIALEDLPILAEWNEEVWDSPFLPTLTE